MLWKNKIKQTAYHKRDEIEIEVKVTRIIENREVRHQLQKENPNQTATNTAKAVCCLQAQICQQFKAEPEIIIAINNNFSSKSRQLA